MAPNDVRKENESIVWERMYEKYLKDLDTPRPPPKYHEGDYVRISREKLLFEKARFYMNVIKHVNLVLSITVYLSRRGTQVIGLKRCFRLIKCCTLILTLTCCVISLQITNC